MLDAAGDTMVSEAAIYSPNTYFTEFSARKLSNARMRGVGSSPGNPAVTTYIDGVAQLNANTRASSSSISARWSLCAGRRVRCTGATRLAAW
jgi:hypothetical protein